MLVQGLVDLARRNVFATLDDEFLDTTGNEKEAVLILHCNVAGMQPAV